MKDEDTILRTLPNELKGKYLESSKRMVPVVLAMRFGLHTITDDGEQREPRTEASREVQRVATRALQAWKDIHAAHWSSMGDPTADKRAAFLRSAQFAKKKLQQIDAEHTSALDSIDGLSKHLETVLTNARKPPSGHGDALIDAEVRAMIAAEKNPTKQMELARAHPRAVATLPPGIGAALVGSDAYNTLVKSHLDQVEPNASADAADLRAALNQLQMATGALNKEARDLIDFETADRMANLGNWQPPTQEAA